MQAPPAVLSTHSAAWMRSSPNPILEYGARQAIRQKPSRPGTPCYLVTAISELTFEWRKLVACLPLFSGPDMDSNLKRRP